MFVSNTSTLILLTRINAIHDFLGTFGKIIIPKKVYEEIMQKSEGLDAKIINILVKENVITVKDVRENKIRDVLKDFKMDNGEAAAYLIFDKKVHKAILTDDRELIKICKLFNIPFLCAMAIVVAFYKKKKYNEEETREKLEQLYEHGRYSKELYTHFLSEVK